MAESPAARLNGDLSLDMSYELMTGWAATSGQEWISFVTVYSFYFIGFQVNACPQDSSYCSDGKTCVDRCMAVDDDLYLSTSEYAGCPSLPYVCSAVAATTAAAAPDVHTEPDGDDDGAIVADDDDVLNGDKEDDAGALSTLDLSLIIASSVILVLIIVIMLVFYRPYKSRRRYTRVTATDNL